MTGRGLVLALAAGLVVSQAGAGDLDRLPETQVGFEKKIESFIKPGSGLEDSLKLLEAHRFECRVFENKKPVIHCLRMEPASGAGARVYQVLIESQGALVRAVMPSVGKIPR